MSGRPFFAICPVKELLGLLQLFFESAGGRHGVVVIAFATLSAVLVMQKS